ncbi:hypothetical protein EJ06DRAFT_552312 [Trichodelitschia bisporula]|uniref:Uncharacterized protein n=1 Tax=Trichodelitschia bisporula TaxID=703511 RepID=A0A6G1I9I1_9PEZI|nr:hypothetical protein EJ06DRAFT_552312 [Trichodelitschia bisporula]
MAHMCVAVKLQGRNVGTEVVYSTRSGWMFCEHAKHQHSITGRKLSSIIFTASPSRRSSHIWCGRTTTRQFATQLGKLGANAVIARDGLSTEEILEHIERITRGRITHALKLVGPGTASVVLRARASNIQWKTLVGWKVAFAPLAMMGKDVVPPEVEVAVVEMKRFVLDPTSDLYGVL